MQQPVHKYKIQWLKDAGSKVSERNTNFPLNFSPQVCAGSSNLQGGIYK